MNKSGAILQKFNIFIVNISAKKPNLDWILRLSKSNIKFNDIKI